MKLPDPLKHFSKDRPCAPAAARILEHGELLVNYFNFLPPEALFYTSATSDLTGSTKSGARLRMP